VFSANLELSRLDSSFFNQFGFNRRTQIVCKSWVQPAGLKIVFIIWVELQKWPEKRLKPILVYESAVWKNLGSVGWSQIMSRGWTRKNEKKQCFLGENFIWALACWEWSNVIIWVLEQSFLVWNLFCSDIFVWRLFTRLDGDRNLSRFLPNTSSFVPNDPSQCLYSVLPMMRCAVGAHIVVGLAERPTPWPTQCTCISHFAG